MNFLVAMAFSSDQAADFEFYKRVSGVLGDCTYLPTGVSATSVPAFTELIGGRVLEGKASDGNFFKRPVKYGVCGDTAVVGIGEVASPARLMIKDPFYVTGYGLGETIKLVKALGKKHIVVLADGGLCYDCAAGAVAALDGKFYDLENNLFVPCLDTLDRVGGINLTEFYDNIKGLDIVVVAEGETPLIGSDGCAKALVGGKGIKEQDIEVAATKIKYFVTQTADLGVDPCAARSGGGCGLSYGMKAFFGAPTVTPYEYFSESEVLKSRIDLYDAVAVFTDGEELSGAAKAIADIAAKSGKECLVFTDKNGPTDCLEAAETELRAWHYSLLARA